MRKTHTLTTKLLLMGLGFLLVAITSIGLTLWITWKLEGSAAAVNEAGRLRMHTLRLALALPNEPLPELQQRVNQFNASLDLLQTGDPGPAIRAVATKIARPFCRHSRHLGRFASPVVGPVAAQCAGRAVAGGWFCGAQGQFCRCH